MSWHLRQRGAAAYASQMLAVGQIAPEFEIPDQFDQPRALGDLLQAGPVVLFFYPMADSPGCTREACHFRDLDAEFTRLGAQRVGISRDSVERQRAFADKHGLTYPLLADVDGAVATAYGVKRGLLGKLMPVQRATFVIGADQRVLRVIHSETNMSKHADEALAALAALRS